MPTANAAEKSGAAIFQELCATCHGAKGEGNDDHYPQPLIGDRSLGELTKYIDKSMPENEPEKCRGDDAQKVATFIYDAFYSRTAQARNKPVRIELARLTVRQYRQTVADLVGSFRSTGTWGDERGLRGEYFKDRRFRDRELERVDPRVQFDFKEAGPVEKIPAAEFAIRWQGSVRAPETGDYEFILRSENGAQLWINDLDRPLIDASVRSGSGDRRESIRLIGGWVYPLRLEFFKSEKAKEKTASIQLLWKPPFHAEELIPERCLSANSLPEVFVVQTPFPPDDRSVGYERGTSISKAWDQATTDAAIEVAEYVAAHLQELTKVRDDATDRDPKTREFCRRFAERAFRKPLTDEQHAILIDRQFTDAGDLEVAVRRVVLLALKSPRFLYREVDGNDAYDVAARLSFTLWDSLPDQMLLDAAKTEQLTTREQVRAQAERMMADSRARAKLRDFMFQWLKVDQPPEVAKDPATFPEFTPAVVSDLRIALDLFVDDVLWNDAADFRQLLLTDSVYLNGRLGQFYGAEIPPDAPFQKVAIDSQNRAGVLSHPYLMAGFAYTSTSSPIHRGVFLSRSILGRALRPPPEAVTPFAPELHADLTTRERVALQTKPENCQSCHAMINPLGFALEHFDAVGRFRKEEKGRPIDATGKYLTRSGDVVQFQGVRDLATFLAGSEETHAVFVERMFQYLVKQPIRAYGPDTPTNLRQMFVRQEFNIRKLAIEIAVTSALPENVDPTTTKAD